MTQTRRSFLVRMMGVTLGTFLMPDSFSAPASEIDGSEEQEETPELNILGLPAPGRSGNGYPLVVYADGEGEMQVWWAADEEEFAAVRTFYLATRNPGCPKIPESEVFPIQFSKQERQLLADILAQPYEDQPRLRYGQWLEQANDPRGEFVRAHVMADRLPETDKRFAEYDKRYGELLTEYGEAWFRPLAALGLWPTMGVEFSPHYWMRGGLIDWVEVSVPGVLPQKASQLFQAAPALTKLTIQIEDLDVAGIVARPEMRQVRSLQFKTSLDPNFLNDGPNPSTFSNEDMKALVGSSNLPSLESLDVWSSSIDDGGFRTLVESSLCGQLLELNVNNCNLTNRAVDTLAASPQGLRIESLTFSKNSLTAEGVQTLLTSTALPRLKKLDVASNAIGPGVFRDLSGSPTASLQTLAVSQCELDDEVVTSLLQWLQASAVEDLDLGYNPISAVAIAPLWKANGLKSLKRIDLSGTFIADAGAKGLASMKRRPESLILFDSEITAVGVQAIAAAPQFARLKELDIRKNAIGLAGARALAASKQLNHLESLMVGERTVGPEGQRLLVNRFGNDVVTLGEDCESEDEDV